MSHTFQPIRKQTVLAAILLGSFLLCLIYSFYHRIHPVVDAQAYDQIGWNLAQGLGFREDATKSYEFDHAITRAGPGYEFFLAGLYIVFGHRYEPVWIAQAFLHTFSAYLLYRIARRVFAEHGETIGLIAATLFAFWPDLIEISAMLMTETVYLFFTILTVYFFVRVCERPERNALAGLLGAVAGVGVLTRPPLVLFAAVFVFFYAQKRQYRALGIFAFLLVATLAPWTLRNYLVYGQPILTTLIGEYNLWLGNTLLSNGGQYTAAYNPLNEYVDIHGFFGLKTKARLEFWGFVLDYPWLFLKLCVVRFIRYFSLIRPMGFWFYQTGWPQLAFVASSLVWIAGVFVAGFSGMVRAWQGKRLAVVSYLVILALTAPILLLPTVVQSRYRFQLYPFLALFAGFAAVAWMRERGWWKERRFLLPFGLLLLVSLADGLSSVQVIIERVSHLFG